MGGGLIFSRQNWHTLKVNEVLQTLKTGCNGLSKEEAEHRLAKFGRNELEEKGGISPLILLLKQFTSFLEILLIAAAAVSLIMGDYVQAIVIVAVIILAGVLGFIQEYRAEKAMEALKKMAAPITSVIRDNEEQEIPTSEVVMGDVIILRTGTRIPADARLIHAINLQVDESPLSGESVPVEKAIDALQVEEAPVGDRKNMVFMGTSNSYGRGKAVVVATGMDTEFGMIASMLQEAEEKETPLQISLNRTEKEIAILALAIAVVIAIFGVTRGYGIIEMFTWGVALAVAIIPEALYAVMTITLARGVQRMAKRNALIRKLKAVETLGCASIICSDKTGTLTRNEMTVRKFWVNGQTIDVTGVGYRPEGGFYVNDSVLDPQNDVHLQTMLRIAVLCNDAHLIGNNSSWRVRGDPTEGALVVAAAKADLWQDALNSQYPRVDEIPFSSESKRMTTIHKLPRGKIAYSKGAPEVILNSCTHIYSNGQEKELTEDDRTDILEIAQQWAGTALRVLGMAYKPLPDSSSTTDAEHKMVFAGLGGMIDPPREEVKEAIQTCENAGIKPIMATGDHKLTAVAVSRELGLLKEGIALSGTELDELSDDEFEKTVEQVEVYARVSPSHKMRIVDAFSKKGYVVAMTGDGVNDAPALKKADIGVAMGITGTDVSKEAADMILTDDNFVSIVSAVEEGRSIFANIRKYLVYLLSGNAGGVIAMLTALLAGLPLPLTAVQIIFINLLMDGLPATALGAEPPEQDFMNQPPRNPKEGIFNRHALWYIFAVGLWIGGATLLVFIWMLDSGGELQRAMTMFFATMISLRLFNAFSCRSASNSLFKLGIFTNKWLIYASASSFLLMIAAIYVPFLQVVFETVPLTLSDWMIVIPVALTVFITVEIAKFIIPLLEKTQIKNPN